MSIGQITCGNFLVHNHFRITGRGLVIAGEIVSGTIAPGNFISVFQVRVRIKSLEFARVSNGEQVGLMLDIAEGNRTAARLDELKGQTLTITADSAS